MQQAHSPASWDQTLNVIVQRKAEYIEQLSRLEQQAGIERNDRIGRALYPYQIEQVGLTLNVTRYGKRVSRLIALDTLKVYRRLARIDGDTQQQIALVNSMIRDCDTRLSCSARNNVLAMGGYGSGSIVPNA